jgi:hypothetical protein
LLLSVPPVPVLSDAFVPPEPQPPRLREGTLQGAIRSSSRSSSRFRCRTCLPSYPQFTSIALTLPSSAAGSSRQTPCLSAAPCATTTCARGDARGRGLALKRFNPMPIGRN